MAKTNELTRFVSQKNQEFIGSIVVEHGPIQLLGRFFLQAVTELAAKGLEIEEISPEELLQANLANSDNWLPLVQVFDPRWSDVTKDNMLAIAIRRGGRLVAAHAVRRFDWTSTTFHDEIESYRFLYRDPAKQMQPGEKVTITARAARTVSGIVGFSGAAWVHPDERGRGLSHIIPRIAKALALSRWDVERIVAVMNEGVFSKGFAPRFGYDGIDWGIAYENSRCGMKYLAILWMERAALESHIADFILDTESDAGIRLRRNQN
jgi:hypothetical protein